MKGGAYAAEALIVARYWMHKQVYFHKTRLACDFHLGEAMKNILFEGGRSGDGEPSFPRPDSVQSLSEFLDWDDYRVMGLLAGGSGGEHGKRLMTRNHYRLACELEERDSTVTELSESAKRNDAVIESLQPYVKFVSQPKTLWYKTKAANDLVLVDDDGRQQIGHLSGYSALMKSINVGSLKFVYVDKVDAKKAKQAYEEFLVRESRVTTPRQDARLVASENSDTPQAVGLADVSNDGPEFSLNAEPAIGKSVQRELLPVKGAKDVV